MNIIHCGDNGGDRKLGEQWERLFCELAGQYGRSLMRNQEGRNEAAKAYRPINGQMRPVSIPDIAVLTNSEGYHEIKQKAPYYYNGKARYGLEEYRINDLIWLARETGRGVHYTIHDHEKAGGRDVTDNNIEHWVTVDVLELDGTHVYRQANGKSYYNSGVAEKAILYWPTDLWKPLASLWSVKIEQPIVEVIRDPVLNRQQLDLF